MKSGREIGEYRIVRLLGTGGMSEVYEAEHLRLGSRHAIKFFTYAKNVDGVKERFLAEGKLLAKLAHPRVVRVTDAGTDPETQQPYFVMDLVADPEGTVRSLADVPAGCVDELQIGMWYDDLCEGLAYIHAKGVIHRDLKLENVLIGPDGHAVLTDFGISKICATAEDDPMVDPVQTVIRLRDGKNPLMGSLGYMAPELEMGVAASSQSDYYALGVIVFRLLTGTWCDARTDIVGNLETYDPVWRQIVPKLLHANPRGRECLSWRELKQADEERQRFAAENALDNLCNQKRRERMVFIVLSFIMVAVVLLAGVILQRKLSRTRQELSIANQELSRVPPPSFEEVVAIPDDAPEDADDDEVITRKQFEAAMPDAWVLVHQTFSELRTGAITCEKAASDIERIAERAAQDDTTLFDPYQAYSPSSEYSAMAELLRTAAKRIREWYNKK